MCVRVGFLVKCAARAEKIKANTKCTTYGKDG